MVFTHTPLARVRKHLSLFFLSTVLLSSSSPHSYFSHVPRLSLSLSLSLSPSLPPLFPLSTATTSLIQSSPLRSPQAFG
ncbi:hypothetical protein RIF29_29539 [Crotalaria pallida]|uniref:Uncharacterized protein n=1 Tax=Crotalaria pallida TaxID=3830 RepID=A0AAN9HXJ7_CROPI